MKYPMNKTNLSLGFTLVETLVASVILLFSVLGFAAAISSVSQLSRKITITEEAAIIKNEIINLIEDPVQCSCNIRAITIPPTIGPSTTIPISIPLKLFSDPLCSETSSSNVDLNTQEHTTINSMELKNLKLIGNYTLLGDLETRLNASANYGTPPYFSIPVSINLKESGSILVPIACSNDKTIRNIDDAMIYRKKVRLGVDQVVHNLSAPVNYHDTIASNPQAIERARLPLSDYPESQNLTIRMSCFGKKGAKEETVRGSFSFLDKDGNELFTFEGCKASYYDTLGPGGGTDGVATYISLPIPSLATDIEIWIETNPTEDILKRAVFTTLDFYR